MLFNPKSSCEVCFSTKKVEAENLEEYLEFTSGYFL
jgi:hypothetical protein